MLQIHILFFLANIGVEDLRFRHRLACILPQHHCKSTAVAGEVRQTPHLAHKIGAQRVADQCAASHNSRTDNDGANNIRTILNVSAAVLCSHIHIIIHGKGNGLSLVILIQRQVKVGRPEIKHHTLGNLRLVQRHSDFCAIRHKAGLLAAGLIGAGFQCIGHINVAVFHSKGAAGHGQGMIDDRLILLPVCRKHFITRQDKLTPGVIEFTVKTQPSSKLVAFSCGSRCKLHALIFMVESIVVVGSFVTNASIQVVLEAVHTGNFLMCFKPAAVVAGLRHITHLISCVDPCPLRIGGGKGFVLLTIGIGVCLHLAVCKDQLTVQIYICFTLVVSSCFTAKAKHLRAGRRFIPGSSNGLGIIDIDDVLMAAHVAVVDVQRSFIVTEH